MSDDPYRLHDRLGFRLTRAARLMQARLETVLAPAGLTRLQWCALTAVGWEGVATPSALAGHLGITRPATSRLVTGLERADLIARDTGPADGRARILSLTETGQTILSRLWPDVAENQAHFTAKLSPEDQAALLRALALIAGDEAGSLDGL